MGMVEAAQKETRIRAKTITQNHDLAVSAP